MIGSVAKLIVFGTILVLPALFVGWLGMFIHPWIGVVGASVAGTAFGLWGMYVTIKSRTERNMERLGLNPDGVREAMKR